MAIIKGTNGNDLHINGTAKADEIFGLAGNDGLIGYGGNDILEGGAGADELFGSDGFDLASYRGSKVGVYVSLYDYLGKYGDAEGDHLYGVEGVIGSAYRDLLSGGDADDTLYGEGGADQLGGGFGNDRLYGGAGNDLLEPSAGNDMVYGDGGVDTASFYNYVSGVNADLGTGIAVGDYTGRDRMFSIENLTGSPYADRLAGNGGKNVLDGTFGADVLSGRGGADTFLYYQTDYSTLTAADRILDFSRSQGDRIDLSFIDANQQLEGNQAFRFIGSGAFTGSGQLRFYQRDGDTIIEANNTDTTAGPEMVIVLDSLVKLTAGDFLL